MPTNIKAGTVTGTGGNINVGIGFNPDHVKVINDTTGAVLEWFSNMPAGHAFKSANGATYAASTKVTTGGISQFGGSATVQAGFTIGNDATNANGNLLRYIATSNGPGAN